jgi:phytoene dehydrogenase-like protein
LSPWEGLSPEVYAQKKHAAGEHLIALARRVYPQLGRSAYVLEVATPQTFQRFTRRSRGAVGGVRQTIHNANQHAIPHKSPLPGFWLAGDSTWPGLGTVACIVGSQIVADGAYARATRPLPFGFLGSRFRPRSPRRESRVAAAQPTSETIHAR